MAKLISLFLVHFTFFLITNSDAASYNILNFGAKADGKTDASQPLQRAWATVCGSSGPSTIYVPRGIFMVTRAAFDGPCRNTAITFSIDGTIAAPSDYVKHGSSGEWIAFRDVDGVSILGGDLDGSGQGLWNCKLDGGSCPDGASSLVFSNSKNIVVDGLTSSNSKLFHIVILHSQNVHIRAVNIIAAANSPNTDGIHVQASAAVSIIQANIKTGDDCISIGPGTAHLWIERVNCGPGHGISIGSLGKKQGLQEESVQNVTVKTTVFSGTTNGVRIKTWGSDTPGHVRGVLFQDALMRNVHNPIIIDQKYCPEHQNCLGQRSGIKISQVRYDNIRGSSATEVAVKLECSPSNPCSNIKMRNIKLTYQGGAARAKSACSYADGIASGFVIPPSCF